MHFAYRAKVTSILWMPVFSAYFNFPIFSSFCVSRKFMHIFPFPYPCFTSPCYTRQHFVKNEGRSLLLQHRVRIQDGASTYLSGTDQSQRRTAQTEMSQLSPIYDSALGASEVYGWLKVYYGSHSSSPLLDWIGLWNLGFNPAPGQQRPFSTRTKRDKNEESGRKEGQ